MNYAKIYNRVATFPIVEVLRHVISQEGMNKLIKVGIKHDKPKWDFITTKTFSVVHHEIPRIIQYTVNLDSLRYRVFKEHGTHCNKCKSHALFFALEQDKRNPVNQNPSKFHFNLYGIDNDGKDVMFSKKKVVKGEGGVENYIVVCRHCLDEIHREEAIERNRKGG